MTVALVGGAAACATKSGKSAQPPGAASTSTSTSTDEITSKPTSTSTLTSTTARDPLKPFEKNQCGRVQMGTSLPLSGQVPLPASLKALVGKCLRIQGYPPPMNLPRPIAYLFKDGKAYSKDEVQEKSRTSSGPAPDFSLQDDEGEPAEEPPPEPDFFHAGRMCHLSLDPELYPDPSGLSVGIADVVVTDTHEATVRKLVAHLYLGAPRSASTGRASELVCYVHGQLEIGPADITSQVGAYVTIQ